jgi:hypothetical protein
LKPLGHAINLPEEAQATPVLSSIYEALPTETSFRLLDFGQGNVSGSPNTLVCSLQTYETKRAPPYRALSYTWGPAYQEVFGEEPVAPIDISCHITCNGKLMPVTGNLFDALLNLRVCRLTGPIWVDALCINQEDTTERSSQVLLMGDIYSGAAEVIVWLGPVRVGIGDFVWALNDFLTALMLSGLPDDQLYASGNITDPVFLQKLGIVDAIPRLVGGAYFYASCRWFNRAWIVQEVLLARTLRIFCGEIELSWPRMCFLANILRMTGWRSQISAFITQESVKSSDLFEEIFRWYYFARGETLSLAGVNHGELRALSPSWLYSHDRAPKFDTQPQSLGPLLRSWLSSSNAVPPKAQTETPFEWLWNTMSLIRPASCSNLRDNVYAVLGIAGRHFKEKPISHYIRPDYNIPPKDLFINIMRLVLEHTPTLDVLGAIGLRSSHPELEGLPSWVPDFTLLRMPQSLVALSVPFDAALCNKYPRPPLQFSGGKMICSGAKFCNVIEVLDINTKAARDPSRVESMLNFCLSLPIKLNGKRRMEVVWRTLIANNSKESNKPPIASFERSFITWLRVMLGNCLFESVQLGKDLEAEVQRLSVLLSRLDFKEAYGRVTVEDLWTRYVGWEKNAKLTGEARLALAAEDASYRHAAYPFSYLADLVLMGRRLFKTENGLLGLGLVAGQMGDEVWFLYGGRTPFVLHPVGDGKTYTLVGECYIHDFMHGEMLEKRWGLKERVREVDIV